MGTAVTSHHQPSDKIVRLFAPDEWCAEHLQVEQPSRRKRLSERVYLNEGRALVEPRLYTGDEATFAFFLGGFVGCMVTVALAYAWSFYL